MVSKAELVPDVERGPGYSVLKISGFPAGNGRLQILRNQGRDFLTSGGVWQAEQCWHDVHFDNTGRAFLGPLITDCLAVLPPNARIQLTAEASGIVARGVQGVTGLYPSHAAVVDAPAPHAEPLSESIVVEPVVLPDPVPDIPVEEPPPVSGSGSSLARFLFPAVLVLALCVVVGGFWYWNETRAPFDPFVPPSAQDAEHRAAPEDVKTREDLATFLGRSPSADATVALADDLMRREKADLAMLAYRYAARSGDPGASLALGRFYDPETHQPGSSPIEKPDAETAAYWYEPAALSGNTEAQRRLGQILLALDPNGYGRTKGLEWLRKAAASGDDVAKSVLRDLGE
ncbi:MULTISPECIES: tetratricopeptide repeat protein [unclassified Haematospirillum]|uniref:tetratricopeptide repeat protein n=1 Tax=unclassified Haematospirillum TaxID=2622088 RepID=UPI00143A785B|nr:MULTISPECIES: sel1 repeat family protein [unclassified Haematospirillum]NKD55035.1 sel1 repeat family protein [Haematospirillum sp. H4890]NKD76069.1 sel1 repeat family protein [Haematospirillum sp. H4485]